LTGYRAEIWEAHIYLPAWLYRWTAEILDLTFPCTVPQFPHFDTGDDETV